jgi:hypothetical protein
MNSLLDQTQAKRASLSFLYREQTIARDACTRNVLSRSGASARRDEHRLFVSRAA